MKYDKSNEPKIVQSYNLPAHLVALIKNEAYNEDIPVSQVATKIIKKYYENEVNYIQPEEVVVVL